MIRELKRMDRSDYPLNSPMALLMLLASHRISYSSPWGYPKQLVKLLSLVDSDYYSTTLLQKIFKNLR